MVGDCNDETNFPHKLLYNKLVQLVGFIDYLLNYASDLLKTVFQGLNKLEDVAKKLKDNDFIKMAKVARALKKKDK